ncbi:cytochrome P450 [Gigaspora rosea]|uniref:Cytochrome P450 n=1 Tax=Gigaspora rosea TaxID=44941 RepID=A0A397UWR3_9GLOM|nr:cytochrome P450 [Gigaspora rosea]
METNRLTPAVNSITRYSTDTCEIAGYKWEKGQYFSINIISLHLHEDYWDNPEIYNPDRFYHNTEINNDIIDIDDTIISKNKFSYTIFGGGLRNYDFELSNMDEDLKIKSAAITACQELKVIIKPRKKI